MEAEFKTIDTRDSSLALWRLACHFSAYSMFFFPFGHLIGPLIVWLAKRDSNPEIDLHGKASLNFQLTMSLIFSFFSLVFIGCIVALVATGMIDFIKTERFELLTVQVILTILLMVGTVIMSLMTALFYWIMIAVNGIRAYDGRPAVYVPVIRFIK